MLIIRKMFSRCLRPLAQQKQQIHVNFLNRFTFKLMLDACFVWRIKLDCITNTSSPFVTHPIIYSYSHIHPTACWKELVETNEKALINAFGEEQLKCQGWTFDSVGFRTFPFFAIDYHNKSHANKSQSQTFCRDIDHYVNLWMWPIQMWRKGFFDISLLTVDEEWFDFWIEIAFLVMQTFLLAKF